MARYWSRSTARVSTSSSESHRVPVDIGLLIEYSILMAQGKYQSVLTPQLAADGPVDHH